MSTASGRGGDTTPGHAATRRGWSARTVTARPASLDTAQRSVAPHRRLWRRDYDAGGVPDPAGPAPGLPAATRRDSHRQATTSLCGSAHLDEPPPALGKPLAHRWLSLRCFVQPCLLDLPPRGGLTLVWHARARGRGTARARASRIPARTPHRAERAWWCSVGSASWRSGLPSRPSYFSEPLEQPLRWSAPGRRTRRRLVIPTRRSTPGGTRGALPYAATGAACPPARAQDSLARIASCERRAAGRGHGYFPLPASTGRACTPEPPVPAVWPAMHAPPRMAARTASALSERPSGYRLRPINTC
jgi:hypothetical protein